MPLYHVPNVPDSLAREIYASLLKCLPPPCDDTPEARISSDSRAMAAVAALIPENAAEAEIAISAVATDFHAKSTLAEASQPRLTMDALKNLRAMTASMSRQSQNLIRTLRQMQVERRKLEQALYPAAMERSGHWFKDSSMMPPGPPPALLPPPTQPTGEPPRRVLAQMDKAEHYAACYPNRAAAIRACGGVPPNCGFQPPDAATVAAIVTSTSPILLELDEPQAVEAASASQTLPFPTREKALPASESPTTSTIVSQTTPLRRP